jgi:thymidylate synthase (FAD)
VKIIEPRYEIIAAPDDANARIERIGRVCYKSEERITDESASPFVEMLVDKGHFPMLDHVHVSVLFVVDRGVSHELVRHRMCAFAQESTRYCNYSKGKFDGECTFIRPLLSEEVKTYEVPAPTPVWYIRVLQTLGFYKQSAGTFQASEMGLWNQAMQHAEDTYLWMVHHGIAAQHARSVLPNSLKTEIVVTADFTEWRHIFKLRTSKAAHPQMRQVMVPCLTEFIHRWPEAFGDVWPEVPPA